MVRALSVAMLTAGGPPAADTWVGKVSVAPGGSVSLAGHAGSVRLDGELAQEIARLRTATVEAVGDRDGNYFRLRAYRILDIDGAKPTVGTLTQTNAGLALNDGVGLAVPLKFSSRELARLQNQSGAKLWVVGKLLVSGELKVLRYGVLREPPGMAAPAQPAAAPVKSATPSKGR